MSHFHIRLKELRRNRNMSQEELARQLGVSRQAIIALEQGVSLPSLPVIMAMLRVLDVPFPDLFHNTRSPFRMFTPEHDRPTSNELALFEQKKTASIRLTLAEDDRTIYISAELAGVRQEDVVVDIGTQHILISAIKKPHLTHECTKTHCSEIEYGPLLRIVSLPTPIDTHAAHAEFNRGILDITLPKLMPESKRRITFKESTTN